MYKHEGRPPDKTTVKKCFEIDQAYKNAIDKTLNCILPSGRLTNRYFECVNTLIGRRLSQDIKNQQIPLLKYTVTMPR